MRKVTIIDRMQRNYTYERTEPIGANFDQAFKPHLTPMAGIVALGV